MDFPENLVRLADFTEFFFDFDKHDNKEIISRVDEMLKSNILTEVDIIHLIHRILKARISLLDKICQFVELFLINHDLYIEDIPGLVTMKLNLSGDDKPLSDTQLFSVFPTESAQFITKDDIEGYRNFLNDNDIFYKDDSLVISELEYVSLYSAINCFRYLIILRPLESIKNFKANFLTKYAVRGGNNEIIHELEKYVTFTENDMKCAYKSYNLNLIEYFHENYNLDYQLDSSVKYGKIHLFLKHLESKKLNNKEIENCIFAAVSSGLIVVMDYLIKKYNFLISNFKFNILMTTAITEHNNHVIDYLMTLGYNYRLPIEAARSENFPPTLETIMKYYKKDKT